MEDFLKKWNFVKSSYYKVISGIVYRNVQAGLIEEKEFKKTTRKVGRYRIIAQHFNTALPYTNYYLIFDNKIYETEQHPIWIPNILKDMVNELKEIDFNESKGAL